ncbi:glycosyltransferase family 4 protein [Candidatus Uhrbacteria bacterium]|nr:glycosyltransferase family 4 protein [Candidatus Uhrbacteria bacterium]
MRIGIDGRTMLNWRGGEGAGIGHYTFLLVRSLLKVDRENEYVLFLDRHISGQIQKECVGDNPRVSIRNFPFRNAGRALPFIYSHMVVSAAFEKANLDILHSPANSLPLFYRKPSVITVHDLAIYDHPEWFPSPFPHSLGFSERIVVPYSVRQARRVIAVSKQTKSDLIRVFGMPEGKIDVIYEGAGMPKGNGGNAVMDRYGLTAGRYFLFLGTLEPRKNIPSAIQAFSDFVREDPKGRFGFELVIAGRRGWKYEPIFEAMTRANLEINRICGDREPVERVRHIGYVRREDKAGLIRNAVAFVFPSFYEGFGLPVIEAMGLGVPVIASNRASLPEICGQACILTEPEDCSAMADAMGRLVSDGGGAEDWGERGRVQAQKFDWDRSAAETLSVYRKALEEPVTDDGDMPIDRVFGM